LRIAVAVMLAVLQKSPLSPVTNAGPSVGARRSSVGPSTARGTLAAWPLTVTSTTRLPALTGVKVSVIRPLASVVTAAGKPVKLALAAKVTGALGLGVPLRFRVKVTSTADPSISVLTEDSGVKTGAVTVIVAAALAAGSSSGMAVTV
jgi:hypothetical protein